MPAEGKWDSDQRDIIQDLLTPHAQQTHTNHPSVHTRTDTEQGSGTRTSGLGFSRLSKTPETGSCVRRHVCMCVSVRVCVVRIIIAYIKAVDSSITATDIPPATETHRPNALTVKLVSKLEQLNISDAFGFNRI